MNGSRDECTEINGREEWKKKKRQKRGERKPWKRMEVITRLGQSESERERKVGKKTSEWEKKVKRVKETNW